MDFFGFDVADFIPCELCKYKPATDIHHIKSRGMGGTKKHDTIENLMALCRNCHTEYGHKKQHYELLEITHAINIKRFTEN
jgi:5-methylcytosine-specific restriction endonuclease McrA